MTLQKLFISKTESKYNFITFMHAQKSALTIIFQILDLIISTTANVYGNTLEISMNVLSTFYTIKPFEIDEGKHLF